MNESTGSPTFCRRRGAGPSARLSKGGGTQRGRSITGALPCRCDGLLRFVARPNRPNQRIMYPANYLRLHVSPDSTIAPKNYKVACCVHVAYIPRRFFAPNGRHIERINRGNCLVHSPPPPDERERLLERRAELEAAKREQGALAATQMALASPTRGRR
jgi:hypothetical protein